MPRAYRKKIICAYAEEELLKLPKTRKPRTVYTEEEKAIRKLERMIKADEREKKKGEKKKKSDWEEKLPVRTGEANIPNGSRVMFISDAKKQFALSDRELASLPIFHFSRSSKRVIALSELIAHAKKRQTDIGVSCPALETHHEVLIPCVMTKTSQFLTGLLGRRDRFGW